MKDTKKMSRQLRYYYRNKAKILARQRIASFAKKLEEKLDKYSELRKKVAMLKEYRDSQKEAR